jgi:hypothetical protein
VTSILTTSLPTCGLHDAFSAAGQAGQGGSFGNGQGGFRNTADRTTLMCSLSRSTSERASQPR